MKADLATLDLAEAVPVLADGTVSSVALTEACLARIAQWQPSRNCFIKVDEANALAAARERDRELARGQRRGPLHGVPLAHKDMFYREGRVTTGGSAILPDQVATTTATVLQRLDDAGAVEIGALNLSEFAAGPTGHNIHYGHCRNAFDPMHVAGGSSSGSATSRGVPCANSCPCADDQHPVT